MSTGSRNSADEFSCESDDDARHRGAAAGRRPVTTSALSANHMPADTGSVFYAFLYVDAI